jgi:hydrogenase nickel incorporation protein HypB
VSVRRRALAASEEHAARLRAVFAERGVLVVNLISSPGSGKTTWLEATIRALGDRVQSAVIEGDVATERDADRIRALGVRAHQVLTGGACHLDARQVEAALDETELLPADLLLIENVGNLICPTTYDLGEDFKVAALSVTEGDDKPFKYPAIFSRAEVTLITKADLLPHVPFDMDAVTDQLATLNPGGTVILGSAVDGTGVDRWCELLLERLASKRATAC